MANIVAIDGNAAIGYIIEARQKAGHGRFASAGGAHKGDHFAGLNAKAYIIKHLFTGVVAKGNIIKADLTLDSGQYFRFGQIPDGLGQIEHIKNTLSCCHCSLDITNNTAQTLNRVSDIYGIG